MDTLIGGTIKWKLCACEVEIKATMPILKKNIHEIPTEIKLMTCRRDNDVPLNNFTSNYIFDKKNYFEKCVTLYR